VGSKRGCDVGLKDGSNVGWELGLDGRAVGWLDGLKLGVREGVLEGDASGW
jgi:hypothetical protein